MNRIRIRIAFVAGFLVALTVSAVDFNVETNICYYAPERAAAEGELARTKCVLDVRWPKGVTNFATIVYFHGGGLVSGRRCFAPWPAEARNRDPVAGVSAEYRFLSETTPEKCIGDAAAAVAWTLANIGRYGGDPKKVFVSGASAGGYLTAMIGMDPEWLKPWGCKPTDLAGIVPLTGQVTKHFNVRAIAFKDQEARYAPKIDRWAPLYWAGEKALPPSLFLTGGRRDGEMPCRVEENELMGISLRRCGHDNASFIETEGSHGGCEEPSSRYLRDFVMKWSDADGVGRFADNERVAFVGDSITHGGGYVAALQLFQNLRHPGCGTRIMNLGISGDTATGGNERLRDDVLAQKPDRAFVMFGMNDVGRYLYSVRAASDPKTEKSRKWCIDNYDRQMRKLVAGMSESGVKTVLMTPTPYDEYATQKAENLPGCNEVGLSACAAAVRRLAHERHFGCIELFDPLTKIFRENPTVAFTGDRVHPGGWGHLLIAAEILDQMRVTPIVAQVVLDARSLKTFVRCNRDRMPETRNARVSALTALPNGGIAFTYAPKALPLPKTSDYKKAESYFPLTERFNQERILVTNLVEGTYALSFDGAKVGSFSSADLAKGVNVALLGTPNQRLAQTLVALASCLADVAQKRRRVELVRIRLRRGKVDLGNPSACDDYLNAWLAECQAKKNPYISAFKAWVDTYRQWAPREKELIAEEENMRERLNAVRPLVARVTLMRE